MKELSQQTVLEVQILEWLQKNRLQITEQVKRAKIIKREYSGSGFFFTFSVPSNVSRINMGLTTIEGPAITSKLLSNGGNSIIFCENGFIKMLEVFGYDNNFPEKLDEFELQESDIKK